MILQSGFFGVLTMTPRCVALGVPRMIGVIWTMIAGAAKYAAAMALGDVAPPEVQQKRAATCATCPHSWRYTLPVLNVVYETCGPEGRENLHGTDVPTCGCLVYYVEPQDAIDRDTEHMRARPAGKTCVASESCPQNRWGACNAVGR